MAKGDYAPFQLSCKLCGRYYDHNGKLVWKDLRRTQFDPKGQHVIGFSAKPVNDYQQTHAVCVHCLKNLGLLPCPPSSSPKSPT